MTALPHRRILLSLIVFLPMTAVAEAPTRNIQDGPAGYSVACSLVDQPGVHSCAELPSAQACEREFDFASSPQQGPTAMTFVNRSEQTVRIYWLDFHGYRKLYQTIPPGGRATQKTFIGHNWLVAGIDDRCIGVFKAAPESLAFF